MHTIQKPNVDMLTTVSRLLIAYRIRTAPALTNLNMQSQQSTAGQERRKVNKREVSLVADYQPICISRIGWEQRTTGSLFVIVVIVDIIAVAVVVVVVVG